MNSTLKRVLSMVMAVAMMITLLPAQVFAADSGNLGFPTPKGYEPVMQPARTVEIGDTIKLVAEKKQEGENLESVWSVSGGNVDLKAEWNGTFVTGRVLGEVEVKQSFMDYSYPRKTIREYITPVKVVPAKTRGDNKDGGLKTVQVGQTLTLSDTAPVCNEHYSAWSCDNSGFVSVTPSTTDLGKATIKGLAETPPQDMGGFVVNVVHSYCVLGDDAAAHAANGGHAIATTFYRVRVTADSSTAAPGPFNTSVKIQEQYYDEKGLPTHIGPVEDPSKVNVYFVQNNQTVTQLERGKDAYLMMNVSSPYGIVDFTYDGASTYYVQSQGENMRRGLGQIYSDHSVVLTVAKKMANLTVFTYANGANGQRILISTVTIAVPMGTQIMGADAIEEFIYSRLGLPLNPGDISFNGDIKISTGTNQLEGTIKTSAVGYIVHYVDAETGESIIPDKKVTGKAYGEQVIEKAADIEGYKVVGPAEQSVTAGIKNNEITFKYTRPVYHVYYKIPSGQAVPPVDSKDYHTGDLAEVLGGNLVHDQGVAGSLLGWTTLDGNHKEKDVDAAKKYPDFVAPGGKIKIKDSDVTLYPIWSTGNSYTLNIVYVLSDGKDGAPDQYLASLKKGNSYNVPSPDVPGYTPNIPVVSGTMPAETVNVTVTYNPNPYPYTVNHVDTAGNKIHEPTGGEAPFNSTLVAAEQAIEIPGYTYDHPDKDSIVIGMSGNVITLTYKANSYDYTVNYVDEEGNAIDTPVSGKAPFNSTVKAADFIKTIDGYTYNRADKDSIVIGMNGNVINLIYQIKKFDYTVKFVDEAGKPIADDVSGNAAYGAVITAASQAKSIDGYTFVSGTPEELTIGSDASKNVIVLTYKVNEYKLTVHYVYENGDTAADDVEQTVAYGADYSVTSPAITGYTPDQAVVSGKMPAKDTEVTVIYTANDYTYKVEYYIDGVKDDSLTETATAKYGAEIKANDIIDKKPSNDYILYKIETVPMTVTEDVDNNVIKVYYEKDVIGEPDPDKPDTIPDRFQAVVTYEAEHGTVSLEKAVVTLFENGEPSATGVGHLAENQIATATANTGYKAKNPLWAPETPTTALDITEDKAFVATFVKDSFELVIHYVYEGGGEAANDYTDTVEFDEDYSVTSPAITGYTPDQEVVSGKMPAKKVEVTVIYTANDYTYKVEYYIDGVKDDSLTETATAKYGAEIKADAISDKKPSNDYILYKIETVPMTVTEDVDNNVIKVYYEKDVIGVPDPEEGDEIPDRFQAVVTYEAEHGTVSLEKAVVTLFENGEPSATGVGHLAENQIATATANTGYKAKNPLWAPETPTTALDITEDKAFVATFVKDSFELVIHYVYEGGGEAANDYTDTVEFDEDYSVTSPSITGYTPDQAVVSGKMPAEKVEVTVIYTANDYTYKVEYYIDGVKDDSLTETATAKYGAEIKADAISDKKPSNDYILYKIETVPMTVTEVEEDNVIKVYYEKDVIGVPDPEEGDEIPDRFQAVVTYEAEHGTVSLEKAVVTLFENGEPSATGVGHLAENQIATATANTGYKAKNPLWAPETPTTALDITEDKAFVATFVKDSFELVIHYVYEGGGEAADDYTDTVEFDEDYSVTSPSITGYTPNQEVVSGKMPAEKVEVTVIYTANDYTYKVEYYIDGVKDDSLTETATAKYGAEIKANDIIDKKPSNDYILYKIETVPMTVTEVVDNNVIKVYYEKDVIGEPDPDKPDTIPDRFQATVIYQVGEPAGNIDGEQKITKVFTLGVEATSGTVPFNATAVADDGYAFDLWTLYDETTSYDAEITGTIAAVGGGIYTFTADFAKDEIGTNPDPDTPDNVPDKYQATVIYKVGKGEGTVNGKQEDKKVFTLGDHATTGDVQYSATAAPAAGYVLDKWTLHDGTEADTLPISGTIEGAQGGTTYTFTADFKKGDIKYTVEYYKEGDADPFETYENAAEFQSTVSNYPAPKNMPEKYAFDYDENVPLTITADPAQNIIKVYYSPDEIGTNPDPDTPDGVPDKYQATVIYKVGEGEGTVNGKQEDKKVFTLGDHATTGTIGYEATAEAADKYAFDLWTLYDETTSYEKTISGTIAAVGGEVYTFTADFAKDEIGTNPDPDTPDNVPDKYQATVIYKVGEGEGTVNGKGVDKQVFTLGEHATSGNVDYSGTAVADDGYAFDLWTLYNDATSYEKTISGTIAAVGGGVYTFTADFAEDKIGTKPGEPDSPDGTPDKYQATVIYQVGEGEGTVNGKDVDKQVFTLGEHATSGNVDYSGTAVADDGYAFDLWTMYDDTIVYTKAISGTIENAQGGGVYTFTADFAVDQRGTNPDPDTPDGVPDKYQVVVTYAAVNGSVDLEKTVVNLYDATGKLSATGIGHLTEDQIAKATPKTGYKADDPLWTDNTPTTELDITEDTDFVAHFVKDSFKLTIHYIYEDKTEAAKDHIEMVEFEKEYKVKSPVIEGYTPDWTIVKNAMPAHDVEVTVTYTAKGDAGYTVHYYLLGTEISVLNDKVVEDATFNQSYTENVVTVDGYTPVSTDSQTVVADYSGKELTFYYYKDVTVTVENASKVYGQSDPVDDYTATVAGLLATDDESVIEYTIARAAADADREDVTVFNDETDTRITLVATGDEVQHTYYKVTYIPGHLAITPATVIVEANADTKVYGDPNPDNYTATVRELVNGDSEYVIDYSVSRAAGEDVGKYTITPAGETVQGNYIVEYRTAEFTITPAPLTIVTQSDSKPYDGTALTAPGTLTGLKNGETANFTVTGSQTTVGYSENTYDLTFDGDATAEESNYYIDSMSIGILTVTEFEGEIVVTTTGITTTYDGKAHGATVTVTGLPKGYFVNDGEAVSNATATDVTTAPVKATCDVLVIRNENGVDVTSDLNITYVNGEIIINPAPLTVETKGATQVYNGKALTNDKGSITGLKNDETATVVPNGSQTAVGESANTYNIEWGTAKKTNYEIKSETLGKLIVTPAKVTVTAIDKTKVYGTTDPALTAKVDGMVSGESASLIKYALKRTAGEDVGTYTITASGEKEQGNYVVEYVNAKLTITPAKVTVTAVDNTKMYGTKDPTLTAVVSGLVNDESEDLITYTVGRKSGEDVGTYAITPVGEAKQGNYEVTYVPAEFTVTVRPVTVVAASNKWEYDGNVHTESGWTVEAATEESGLVGTDEIASATVEGEIRYPGTTANVASKAVFAKGTNADNYDVSYKSGTLEITDRSVKYRITATANSGSFKYDGKAHKVEGYELGVKGNTTAATMALTFLAGGKTEGDTVTIGGNKYTVSGLSSVTKMTDAGKAETLIKGEAKITDAKGVDVTAQFALDTIPGQIEVTKRTVVLQSQDAAKRFDGEPLTKKEIIVGGDGFVKGEGAKYEVTGTRTKVGKAVNTFTYKLTSATKASNYKIKTEMGTLTVTPIPVYTLTVHYVDTEGATVAPDYIGTFAAGEQYMVYSPAVEGYTPDFAYVRSAATGMPEHDVVLTVVYTKEQTKEVPPGAEIVPDGPDYDLVPVDDEDVPLAGGEHKDDIMHFLLMAAALIIEAFYTDSKKKHQKKIFELKKQLGDTSMDDEK